ncbi:MAG: hypothetical protein FWD54_07410, partial [Endomicrobia bacterium]|nr:hypothetical protein [Endomicrobiia bacterium]
MRKILAILLSITFVCNIAAESVYGVVLPAVANNQYNINKNFSVGNFNTANDNLVLLIQDLHCHYDTQVKISELLRNISKQDNFNKIFVEGASADITGSFIKSLPENIKNPLIENLLKEGKLNGAEYFFLTNDTVVPLYALENEELYSQSGEGLQYILNAQKEVDKIISEMDRELKASQRQNLSGSSRKMLSAVNKYENKKLEQSRYYKYLIKEAKKQKINLNKYREILSVADIETKINAKKV